MKILKKQSKSWLFTAAIGLFLLLAAFGYLVYLFVFRTGSYLHLVFWLGVFAEICLAITVFKIPLKKGWIWLRYALLLVGLLLPNLLFTNSDTLYPASNSFIAFLAVLAFTNLFKWIQIDLQKSAQTSRIGEPASATETRLEDVKGKKPERFNAKIERTFDVSGDEELIQNRIIAHMVRAGYERVNTREALVFKRGNTIDSATSFFPDKWECIANVIIFPVINGVRVNLRYDINVDARIIDPWEKTFWRREIHECELALDTDTPVKLTSKYVNDTIEILIAPGLILLFVLVMLLVLGPPALMYIVLRWLVGLSDSSATIGTMIFMFPGIVLEIYLIKSWEKKMKNRKPTADLI